MNAKKNPIRKSKQFTPCTASWMHHHVRHHECQRYPITLNQTINDNRKAHIRYVRTSKEKPLSVFQSHTFLCHCPFFSRIRLFSLSGNEFWVYCLLSSFLLFAWVCLLFAWGLCVCERVGIVWWILSCCLCVCVFGLVLDVLGHFTISLCCFLLFFACCFALMVAG